MSKILLALSLILAGCGSDIKYVVGPQGVAGTNGVDGVNGLPGPTGSPGASAIPLPSPSPISSQDANSADIQDVLTNGAHGNAYRLGLGQTELSPNLSCQVQKVSANQCLSNSSSGSTACVGQPVVTLTGTTYTYAYSGPFNQPSTNSGANGLLPVNLQTLFTNVNYRIVCTGQIVIQTPGWYEFEDQSDDGSIIYLDGGTLYNDGQHGLNAVPVVQSVYFDRDVHSFQVWYSQTGGGAFGLILNINNNIVPSNLYYH